MDVNTLLGWLKIKPYIHSFEFLSLDKFYYGIKRNEWVGSFSDIKLCPLSTTGSGSGSGYIFVLRANQPREAQGICLTVRSRQTDRWAEVATP